MQYIKIGDNILPAEICGEEHDKNWNDRESVSIKIRTLPYQIIEYLFQPHMIWSIIVDDEGNLTEYDKSDYCLLGDITIHPDNTTTIKLGKLTILEKVLKVDYGEVK